MHALDAASGTKQWRFSPTESPWFTSPIVHDGLVYCTIAHKGMYALDAATESVWWSHTDNHRYTAFSLVADDSVSDPHLIAGTKSGVLCRFNLKTGRKIWQRDLFGPISAFSFKSSSLYVGTSGGEVYTFYTAGHKGLTAIRDYDTKKKWRVDGRYDTTKPAGAGDTMYVSNGSAVHAFAMKGGCGIGTIRTRAKRWSHPTPAKALGGLAVADGALFVACAGHNNNPTLYCLESAESP
ncbi:PQQ-like beta-propeller repeat protein [Halocatena marina]|uniref:PQQ-like beta-propeller repeat protein n=1 Tax=Halocatena marina TaxID=2934937 RepID=A0ABD5YJJ7_9EURY|nr:PQQ-like beta-propeller repeat protein [Halocatena marina]